MAFAVRLVGLDHTPFIDELNHVLAAQSLLEDGDLAIYLGDTSYDRAWIFTWMVAAMQWAFGDSLVVARLPAVAAGVALTAAVHLSVARVAGAAAGLFAGLLLALDPTSIYLSQLARFYTLHALFVWLATAGLLRTMETRFEPRHLIGAAASFVVAFHLQETTLIAGLAAALAAGMLFLLHPRHNISARAWAIVLGAVAAAITIASVTGFAAEAWTTLTTPLPWAADDSNNVLFYHYFMIDRYPLLWLVLPVLMTAAAALRPTWGLYGGTFFLVAIAVHSLAATKAERYIYYTMPWLFCIAGIGLSWGWTRLKEIAGTMVSALSEPWRSRRWLPKLVLALTMAYLVALQPAFRYTWDMLTISDHSWPEDRRRYRGKPDWEAAASLLQERAGAADVLVSSNDLAAIHYLGRVDAIVSRDHQIMFAGGTEFGESSKVGVPVFSSGESLESLLVCKNVLLVAEDRHLEVPYGVPAETRAAIRERMNEIELPPELKIAAFESADARPSCPR